jgi:carotenoid cleavage dioxygenase
LCIATDRTDLTSRLLVIAAADPGAGPFATVHLPQRVPAGLHGAWLPTQE